MKPPLLSKKKVRILLYCTLLLTGLTYCTIKNGYVLNDTHGVSVIPNPGPYKGVGAYIINLDRSKERWAYVTPYVDKLGFPVERISAVDGKLLSDDYINKNVDQRAYSTFNHMFTKGALGCSLSHIKAWKTFLESNFEYALIFEDDVSFNPIRLRSVVDQLLDIPTYWDITAFNMHAGENYKLTLKHLQDDQNLCIYPTKFYSSGAYIINRKAARNLLQKSFPILMSLDVYYTRAWEFDLKFTGIENPRLVHQTYGNSDIGYRVHNRSFLQIIMRFIHLRSTDIMRLLYNTTYYVENFL